MSRYLHQTKNFATHVPSILRFFFAVSGVLIILFNLAKPLSFTSRSMKDVIKKDDSWLVQQRNTLIDIHLFVHFDTRAALCLPRLFCFCISLVSGSLFTRCCLFQFFASGLGSA